MSKHFCPNCGGTEFYVTAHVAQVWKVDENGEFVSCFNDCSDFVHIPDCDDLWKYTNCGTAAVIEEE